MQKKAYNFELTIGCGGYEMSIDICEGRFNSGLVGIINLACKVANSHHRSNIFPAHEPPQKEYPDGPLSNWAASVRRRRINGAKYEIYAKNS
jgi:hypothetical protein